MRSLPVLASVSAAGLIAFGAFAYNRRVDVQAAADYSNDLQHLLALDFRLDAEVLKARSGAVSHYDGIVQAEASLVRVHDKLKTTPRFLSDAGATELQKGLSHSERLFLATRDLVEVFKRENAVLRNSLRYLPVLARELNQPGAEVPIDPALGAALDALVRDELLVQGWHDPSILDRVTSGLDALTANVASATSVDREQLAIAVTHARIVQERSTSVHKLTRSIIAQPTVGAAQALVATFAAHHDGAIERAKNDAAVFFGLALVTLLLAAASVITRLSDSARALRQAGVELAQANAALIVEQARQQELNNLKTRFVSMTSHEFRTPLSTILSSADLLAAYSDRWTPEKKGEHFDRIRHAVLNMTRMLDGILMIGRSDAGVLEFNPKPTDIVRACAKSIDGASSLSTNKHEIIYEGPTGSEMVNADEDLLKNILGNLLSNAVKYSPTGGHVTLKLAREGEQIRIDVSDEGIGIADADRAHLFDTFRRGSNVGTISGTGLGLAITKRAVDLHGGTLSLESAIGRGTTFTVRLPCGAAST